MHNLTPARRAIHLGVVGLGYVGAPLAYSLAEHFSVIGVDNDSSRIYELRGGRDRTGEVPAARIVAGKVALTTDFNELGACDAIIVTVPTPTAAGNVPDLEPVLAACRSVGPVLKRGAIVVFESTVYPGVTRDVCVPALEQSAGKQHMRDFFVGYSPERINPGDPRNTLETVTKIVAGDCAKTLEAIDQIYSAITTTHRAPRIEVAEAAKVVENIQRDVNIALMNELSQIFRRLDIDTHDVLVAAGTKWNFHKYTPGLVGGHCISVDPYYLSHQAAVHGYVSDLILAARAINEGMPMFIVKELIKLLSTCGTLCRQPVVTILGAAFKENVPDIRNSKVGRIVKELAQFGIATQVLDPLIDPIQFERASGFRLANDHSLRPADLILLAVPHTNFIREGWAGIQRYLHSRGGMVMDLKGALPKEKTPQNVTLWRP